MGGEVLDIAAAWLVGSLSPWNVRVGFATPSTLGLTLNQNNKLVKIIIYVILTECIVNWTEKQITEKQNRPILIKNVQNWTFFEYHIGLLCRSVTLVLECHCIGQKLRQVSGGCISRFYVL